MSVSRKKQQRPGNCIKQKLGLFHRSTTVNSRNIRQRSPSYINHNNKGIFAPMRDKNNVTICVGTKYCFHDGQFLSPFLPHNTVRDIFCSFSILQYIPQELHASVDNNPLVNKYLESFSTPKIQIWEWQAGLRIWIPRKSLCGLRTLTRLTASC